MASGTCQKCGLPGMNDSDRVWVVDKNTGMRLCVCYCDSTGADVDNYDLCLSCLQIELERFAFDLTWKLAVNS